MKIRFLGTSHGVPMPGRHYQSILIETQAGSYLVDAGAPVMDILINENYDLNKIRAVFVTHLHGDHVVGLVDMVNLATWYYKEMNFGVYLPEQRGIDAITQFNDMLHMGASTERITYHVLGEGSFYDDGNLKVTAVPTAHLENSTNLAYGFAVEAEGKKLYVTGDMHNTLKDFPVDMLAEPHDAVICECAHFPAELLIEKLKAVNVKKGIVVHVYPVEKYDVLQEFGEEAPFELVLPDDGDMVEI